MRENESDCVAVNRRESGSNFTFVCEKGCTPRLPPNEGPFLKGPYLWRYGTHRHKLTILQLKITQVSENGVLLPRKNVEVCEQFRSDYSK